ncbi:MAG: glycosyltransferase family 4 protein [Candidatus Woesebacteria bacterium]|jgi:glycosyltransferase involved in cell wall biosynthesis
MKKKQLLILAPAYHPSLGGVETHLRETNQILAQKGYQIVVLSPKHKTDLKDEEEIDGIRIIRFSYPQIKFLGLLVIWWQLFKLFISKELFKIKLIHIHDVSIWFWPFKLLSLIHLWPKQKIVLTMHGWEGSFPIPKKNILYKRLAAKLADKVICVGSYIEKYYAVKADALLYGGVRHLGVTASRKKAKSIVYLGRLDQDNGLDVLLATLALLPDYRVNFCGDGPLRTECKKYGKVHGFLLAKDYRSYLKKAEICFAGGYLSMLEGMIHQCLVVAAYDNHLREDYLKMSLFKDYLLIDSSPEKLADQIKDYQKNSQKKEQFLKKVYNLAKKQSWEQVVEIYLDFYAE